MSKRIAVSARLRADKGLTQKDIAERFGVISISVSRWERGECLPHVSVLQGLAEFYGSTLDELLVELPHDSQSSGAEQPGESQ